MSPRASLAYGLERLEVELPDRSVIVEPPALPAPSDLGDLLESALNSPIGAHRLESIARRGDRVLLITSDHTRADPRRALLNAVYERLPDGVELGVAVATGTHSPGDDTALDLPEWVPRVLQPDARDPSQFVEVGRTRRGTPVRVHRAVLEADLIVATGSIRPHYFAGFGAGSKAVFPGLGENESVRINHRLKLDPSARPGVVEGNACRDDLEEALDLVGIPCFLLDTVEGPDKRQHHAVAGDPREAFRFGAELCRPLFLTDAPRARRLLLSDREPIAGSLYQASKMVAMAAELLEPGGVVILAVECRHGPGPIDVVNQAIYEIGLKPRLPEDHSILLCSSLSAGVVETTYCRHVERLADVLDGPVVAVPDAAGSLLYRVG